MFILDDTIRADINLGGIDGIKDPLPVTIGLKGTGVTSKTSGATDYRFTGMSGESLSHKVSKCAYKPGSEQYHAITLVGGTGKSLGATTLNRITRMLNIRNDVGCSGEVCFGPRDKLLEYS